MSKLISNPFECGYHDDEENKCMYPQGNAFNRNDCIGDQQGFPTNCPLQDGIEKPKLVNVQSNYSGDEDQQSDKKVGELITSLLKPSRRNRKDCIHYDFTDKTICECSAPFQPFWCIGVNCGHFKTK